MRTQVLQSHCTSGVLDGGLAARTDITHYYQGVRQGDNVIGLPQGGLRRRPGTAHVGDFGGPVRLAGFMFNTEQTYLVAFSDLLVTIYENSEQVAQIATVYTADQIDQLDWVQSADTMIIVHPDVPPQQLFRGPGGSSDWTFASFPLRNIPEGIFVETTTPGTQVLTFTMTETEQFRFLVNGRDSDVLRFTGNAGVMAERIRVTLLQSFLEQGLPAPEITVTGSNPFTVTLDGGAASAEQLAAVQASAGGTFSVSGVVVGSAPTEPIWSAARGWPRSVVFHESRLIFGGSRDQPNTIAMSVTNAFDDFLLGDQYPDQAIVRTIDSDQLNAIVGLATSRRLQVFTSGGEFYVPQIPMTPDDVTLPRQTNFGSAGIRPEVLDGATLFVDRSRRVIREFLFEFAEDGYTSASLNALAPHLITGVRSMAVQRTGGSDTANYLYACNDDGTCAVLNTLREQSIAGWWRWTTDGEFYDVAVEDKTVFFVVKRVIQGVTRYHIERLDDALQVDDGRLVTYQTPQAVAMGFSHVTDKVCSAVVDGVVVDPVIPINGQVELERAGSTLQVGLNYIPVVRPMPLNSGGVEGQIAMHDKRVLKVRARVKDTRGLRINGDDVQGYRFGTTLLGDVRAPYTGVIEHRPSSTPWSDDPEVVFSQSDPLPMTLLGFDVTVEY